MKVIIKKLEDLNIYLTSSDYKVRMIGEVLELGYRIHKLRGMLDKTPDERGFEFTTPRNLLEAQLNTMKALYHILINRSELEDIEIPEVFYGEIK